RILAMLAGVLLIASAVAKGLYWRRIDAAPQKWSAEAATGLGSLGFVRPLDPPHTRPNFVMREMGFAVARKHAQILRMMAILAGFLAPALLLLLAAVAAPGPAAVAAVMATLGAAAGVLTERWLFFAEARHVAMLYYGEARV
ncbi:MAG: dimethyl sulfoxide reductase anchor subunit, partial [Proteobacteria bacterium]|nr:dimethyl sulfoxide reductase anchor subunit [Pseudomonadota bacterium]